jgi:hypothetical protein
MRPCATIELALDLPFAEGMEGGRRNTSTRTVPGHGVSATLIRNASSQLPGDPRATPQRSRARPQPRGCCVFCRQQVFVSLVIDSPAYPLILYFVTKVRHTHNMERSGISGKWACRKNVELLEPCNVGGT